MDNYDVVVVGGGAAGLAAAVSLGRMRRSVLVIDAGHPRNAAAEGVHGFLSRDGMPPGELLAAGRGEVREYGGVIRAATAIGAAQDDDGFVVQLAEGGSVHGRRLLVTTGLVDELPEIAGIAQQWGRGVVHCPYCHGWEVRDRAIGVIATGPMAVHQTQLFRQVSTDITLFTNGNDISEDDRTGCVARGIRIFDGLVESVRSGSDGEIDAVVMRSGQVVARDVVAIGAPVEVTTPVLAGLGLQPVPHPSGMGVFYESQPNGATVVPGLFLAGNVTDPSAQVVAAAAGGNFVGAWINADLVEEEKRTAVDGFSADFDPNQMFRPGFWDELYTTAASRWSGRVNAQLEAEAADLAPGRALDVGCGEGADACWLAERGWDVVGIDVSQVALQRASIHAADAGLDDRIAFEHRDLLHWSAEPASFDLVSAQFMHLPDGVRETVYAGLAAAVRPGGTLLVVAHRPTGHAHADARPDMFFTAEQLATEVLGEGWTVAVSEVRHRQAVHHGELRELSDVVLRAVRS